LNFLIFREALSKKGFIVISHIKTELCGLKRRFGNTLSFVLEWELDGIGAYYKGNWIEKRKF